MGRCLVLSELLGFAARLALGLGVILAGALLSGAAVAADPAGTPPTLVTVYSCLPPLTLGDYYVYFGGFALILVAAYAIRALRQVLGRY